MGYDEALHRDMSKKRRRGNRIGRVSSGRSDDIKRKGIDKEDNNAAGYGIARLNLQLRIQQSLMTNSLWISTSGFRTTQLPRGTEIGK